MDKKMSRQILFKKEPLVELKEKFVKVQTEAITKSKPIKSPIVKVDVIDAKKSEMIYDWVKAHPLINLNGVCKAVGIDRANFLKMAAKNKELKSEVIESFVKILTEYGYTPTYAELKNK